MHRRVVHSVLLGICLLMPLSASAQVMGAYRWQLQPYCNVVTVNVTQQNGTFTLDGVDDQCGAGQQASIVGTAFLNPDGTVGIGLTTVLAPGGTPVHVDARINLASLNGPWRDSAGNSGTFVFTPGPGIGGSLRPVPANGLAPGSITAVQIAPGAVTAGQIAAGAVGMGQIAAGSIASTHLAPGLRSTSGAVTLTNANWAVGIIWLTTGSGVATGNNSRVATIAVPELTQAVIDSGSVNVVARLYNDPSAPEWGPLPYDLTLGATGSGAYRRKIDVRFVVGAIKLYYSLPAHDLGVTATPGSLTIPDLPVRWTIRPAGL